MEGDGKLVMLLVVFFLDLNDRTISLFECEFLLDPPGSEMAFDNVQPTNGLFLQ
jgi:hypothetical protein